MMNDEPPDRHADRDDEPAGEREDRPRRRRPPPRSALDEPGMQYVLPVNTSGLAIAAGYVGLISVLCFPAPIALVLGILALRHLKKNPRLHGHGRTIFAIVIGALFTIPLVIGTVALMVKAASGK